MKWDVYNECKKKQFWLFNQYNCGKNIFYYQRELKIIKIKIVEFSFNKYIYKIIKDFKGRVMFQIQGRKIG